MYVNPQEMMCLVKTDPRREVLAELAAAKQAFIRQLAAFSPEQLNLVPFAGSWTAAQVAAHLLKSDEGMIRMFNGPQQDTERDPGEKLGMITASMLDFTTKLHAPAFVVPESKEYDKERLLAATSGKADLLLDVAGQADLSKTCLLFEFPVYGQVTGLELAWFMVCHTKRHLHQLSNIAGALKAGSEVVTS